jgi:carboxypeptidase Q
MSNQEKAAKMILKRVGIAVLAIALSFPLAAQQDSQSMIGAIKAEGLRSTEARVVFHMLTDTIGPRLTGSPAHVQAARWAVERLKAWGLDTPRLEPFQFGRGWSLEKLTLEMTAPRYMPLIGYAEAWSPATSGVLTGTPVYIGDSTAADIDRLGPRLRGAIVLMHRPQTEFLRNDRPEPSEGDGPVRTGNPPLPGPSSMTPTFDMLSRLRGLGAGVAITPGAMEHGTVRVQGFRNSARDAVPTVVVAAEHYNMLVRMVQAGTAPQLRIEVGVRTYENDLNSYNVLAEIPGTDPLLRDEVVLVGAHLDSWHTGTGATDNADGATAVLEAMRILMAVHARPRRTIRVALWGGEEQGLLGASAYINQHLRDDLARSKISVYLNDDPGSGASYGFYMEHNELAKRIFDAWLEPLRDIGVRRNVIEGIGATDHVPFNLVGIPAFTVIKDFRNYDVRTRHTNADLADAVRIEDLRQASVFMAAMTWQAATRDEPIPRQRR